LPRKKRAGQGSSTYVDKRSGEVKDFDPRTYVKKSGCKYHPERVLKSGKKARHCINMWCKDAHGGIISVIVSPYKNTHKSKSKRTEDGEGGIEYENWMASLRFGNGTSDHFPVLVDLKNKKVTLKKMGLIGGWGKDTLRGEGFLVRMGTNKG